MDASRVFIPALLVISPSNPILNTIFIHVPYTKTKNKHLMGVLPLTPQKTEEAYHCRAAVHIFRVAAKDLAASVLHDLTQRANN